MFAKHFFQKNFKDIGIVSCIGLGSLYLYFKYKPPFDLKISGPYGTEKHDDDTYEYWTYMNIVNNTYHTVSGNIYWRVPKIDEFQVPRISKLECGNCISNGDYIKLLPKHEVNNNNICIVRWTWDNINEIPDDKEYTDMEYEIIFNDGNKVYTIPFGDLVDRDFKLRKKTETCK